MAKKTYMAKKENKYNIPIKDIKSLSEIEALQGYIKRIYGGDIPENIYNSFLRVISSPYWNSYFRIKFKPKPGINGSMKSNSANSLEDKDHKEIKKENQNNQTKKVKKKQKAETYTSCSSDLITVKTKRLYFKQTLDGCMLKYQDYSCFFLID